MEDVVIGLDIEAIEVYRGIATPVEFVTTGHLPSGAIVIWTRR